MSLSVATDVFCDHEDCVGWIDGVAGRLQACAREARQRARDFGWTRRAAQVTLPSGAVIGVFQDYCPEHSDRSITGQDL